jgi:hypothetical protein
MMNRVKIELRLPFEKNIERTLSLSASLDCPNDEEVVRALRRLYELAHGRSVQTALGLVAIAPPVAPSLSQTTFSVASRSDLLTAVQDQIAAAFSKP